MRGHPRSSATARRAPRAFALAALLLACAPAPAAAQGDARLVAVMDARVRALPSSSAATVGRPRIAEILPLSGGAGAAGAWTAVMVNGRRGWISSNAVLPVDPARPWAALHLLATRRLAREGGTFAEWSRLAAVLDSAAARAPATAPAGQVALDGLHALQRALDAHSAERRGTVADYAGRGDAWLNAHAADIVYSEPAGQWLVRADRFWELRERHAGQPVDEAIAWAAAHQPQAGECEDDPDCQFSALTWSIGRYLELYPRGAHATAALAEATESLGWITQSARRNPICREPREGTIDLARLRAFSAILARTAAPARDRASRKLAELTRLCTSR